MNKEGFKVVVWDIETWDFKPNVGMMLLSAIKQLGKPPTILTNKNLGKNSLDDKEICIKTKELLEEADIIITFYGLGFDLKFLNSRLMYWGEKPVKQKLHIDMYRIGKKYFNTSRRSLGVITSFLGIKGKTHVEMEHWREMAFNGDKEALKYAITHVREDVKITEQLFYRLKDLIKGISLA